MKKLLSPLKIELRNCVGTSAEIETVQPYLPGSVLIRARLLKAGGYSWHTGSFVDGVVSRDAGEIDDTLCSVTPYSEGFLIRRIGKRFIKVSEHLEMELKALYGADEVWPCREGFIRFRKGKRFGFLNRDGEMVIDPVYEDARDFCGGFAYVQVFGGGENKRLIDTHGRTALSVKAEYVSDVHDGQCLLSCVEGGETVLKTIFDVGGENREAYLCEMGDYYSLCQWSGESLFVYRIGGMYGVVNVRSGHPCPSCWDRARRPTQGLCAVEYADTKKPERHMLIDGNFRRVGGLYEALEPVSCSLALAKREGKYGYINTYGQEKIPFCYADAESFAHGTALVKADGEAGNWMVIDTDGNLLEADGKPLIFEGVTDVHDGPVFAILKAKDCTYIFDHRFYGEDFHPLDEPETICDLTTFMHTTGERLFEEEKPKWNERFRMTAPDCEAARLMICDYMLHVKRYYGLNAEYRSGEDADVIVFSRVYPSPSRSPEETKLYDVRIGMNLPVTCGLMKLRVETQLHGDHRYLILTGIASDRVQMIDDGARARMTRADIPMMVHVREKPLTCFSDEMSVTVQESGEKKPAWAPAGGRGESECRLSEKEAHRFCSFCVTGYRMKAYLDALQCFGATWQEKKMGDETVYAVTENHPGRTQCNTLSLDGGRFSVLIFYAGTLSGQEEYDADTYFSHEYRFT